MNVKMLLVFLVATCCVDNSLHATQTAGKDCAVNCLAVAFASLGVDFTMKELSERIGAGTDAGYTLEDVATCAKSFGLHSMAVETTLDSLLLRKRFQRFACIAWLPEEHFVVLSDFDGVSVDIIDAPYYQTLDAPAFKIQWKGHALLLSPDPLASVGALQRRRWLPIVGLSLAGLVCLILVSKFCISRLRSSVAIFLFLASGCSAVNFYSSSCFADDGATEMIAKPNALDLGTVDFQSEKEYELILKNQSNESVSIRQLVISCRCVVVKPFAPTLQPRETRKVAIQIETHMRGPKGSTLKFFLDNDRVITIPVRYDVAPLFRTEPEELEFGTVAPGKPLH